MTPAGPEGLGLRGQAEDTRPAGLAFLHAAMARREIEPDTQTITALKRFWTSC